MHNSIGVAYYDQGIYDSAQIHYEQAITAFSKAKEYVDNGRAIDAWKLLLAKK